ncbi:MAG: amidohydrolase [Proteobacteria bacterium]|nr:amidohydrolase [Pseudomonadota bacterium]
MSLPAINRRHFLTLAGPAACVAYAGGLRQSVGDHAPSAGPIRPDVIVVNANVYTVDTRLPRATAFAVAGGRFQAVGTDDEIRNLARRDTPVFDAQRMTIVPGFIDCHNHSEAETLLYGVIVGNPFEVELVTIDSIVDKLQARVAETPPGEWIEGQFFDDTKVRDGRSLNIHDLDRVSLQHPVAVHHRGGHTAFYNSKAFQLAGITKSSPNPPGGTFDRDAQGELNGRVTDTAMDAFEKVGTHPTHSPTVAAQRRRDSMAYISKQFVRYGLTSVHHDDEDHLLALQQIRAAGDLKHRVTFEPSGAILAALLSGQVASGFGDDWIRFGATSEHTVDGSFSERTMALSQPYIGRSNGYRGNVTDTQDGLNAWVEQMLRAGIRPNCHANGDVAIDMVLTAYERGLKAVSARDVRPKITHCTLVNEQLLRRMKAIDAVPAVFSTYAYYNADKFHFYGEALMRNCMAYRSFLDAGVQAAAGSDFGPGPFAPLMGIQGMVTRRGWNGEVWGANQRVSVGEALRINTLNGAYNSKEETNKGSITAGRLADFVVLAEDPHSVDPNRIADIKIVRTVTGGDTVYQA